MLTDRRTDRTTEKSARSCKCFVDAVAFARPKSPSSQRQSCRHQKNAATQDSLPTAPPPLVPGAKPAPPSSQPLPLWCTCITLRGMPSPLHEVLTPAAHSIREIPPRRTPRPWSGAASCSQTAGSRSSTRPHTRPGATAPPTPSLRQCVSNHASVTCASGVESTGLDSLCLAANFLVKCTNAMASSSSSASV